MLFELVITCECKQSVIKLFYISYKVHYLSYYLHHVFGVVCLFVSQQDYGKTTDPNHRTDTQIVISSTFVNIVREGIWPLSF